MVTLSDLKRGESSSPVADTELSKTPSVVLQDVKPRDDSAENRAAFLSSFTPEENHAIIPKVDRRFLLIIGMMYLIKNVSYLPRLHVPLFTILADRLPKCSVSQGPTSSPTGKHP